MATSPRFKPGDLIMHVRRPEWGEGVVDQAIAIEHEGSPAQRLVVRFTHHGRVTLNTAIAPLVTRSAGAGEPLNMTRTTTSTRTAYASPAAAATSDRGWLAALENKQNDHELHRLPDNLSDPFLSSARRLANTLENYRFNSDRRTLIDWAVAQTGLHDPLSKYTRHELEQAFGRFAHLRDQHLTQLVRQMKKQGQLPVIEQTRKEVRIPAAQSALDRALRA